MLCRVMDTVGIIMYPIAGGGGGFSLWVTPSLRTLLSFYAFAQNDAGKIFQALYTLLQNVCNIQMWFRPAG